MTTATVQTDDLHADLIRSAVMDYMSHRGPHRWRLTDAQWSLAYLLGDGFGRISWDFAQDQCWDWSHVRDSSPQSLARIWEQICRWHNAGQLKNAHDLRHETVIH